MDIAEAFGYISDKKLYKEDPTLISSDHGVGVEVEIENVEYDFHGDHPEIPRLDCFRRCNNSELPRIDGLWNIVRDGSLRRGSEFIFKEPYKGANIISALESMNNFLSIHRRNNMIPIASDRCSVHVHLDARDLDEVSLNNLILIYLFVERILFQYVSPTRIKNNYCRPLSDSSFKFTMNELKSVAINKQIGSLVSIINNSCDKYSALNMRPLTKFGSVEFRHHEGTTDMNKVKEWINIIIAIKVAALKYDVSKLIAEYEKSPRNVLSLVFNSTKINQDFLDRFDWEFELSKGYNDVKEVLDFENLLHVSQMKVRKKAKEKSLIALYIEKNGIVINKEAVLEKDKMSSNDSIDLPIPARPGLTARVATNSSRSSTESSLLPRLISLSREDMDRLSPGLRDHIAYLRRVLVDESRELASGSSNSNNQAG